MQQQCTEIIGKPEEGAHGDFGWSRARWEGLNLILLKE
jgi:hypothetical protein